MAYLLGPRVTQSWLFQKVEIDFSVAFMIIYKAGHRQKSFKSSAYLFVCFEI